MEVVLHEWICEHLTFEDLLAFFFPSKLNLCYGSSYEEGHFHGSREIIELSPVYSNQFFVSVFGAVDRNLIRL